MPARTLSDSPELSPPRFYSRRSPYSSHPRRESHDDRLGEPTVYAVAMPPSNSRPDNDYAPNAPWQQSQSRIYPDPSSIPPHWQIHPSSFRDPRPYLPPAPVLQATSRVPWQNVYPRFVQVQPFVAPPPSPLPHKVWILDCKACGTFLTNRGMKAVLLLRPNVPLYSTDALPVNCSAFSTESESPTLAQLPSGPSSSPPGASIHAPQSAPGIPSPERSPARTCECLTQTLCCHGCGTAVGYMIVSPCQRCTSSITVNNRATNGHRFVFYSSEITACERHYVKGERGVNPFHPVPPPTPQTIQSGLAGLTIGSSSPRPLPVQQPSPPSTSPTASTPSSLGPSSPTHLPDFNRQPSGEYLPTPPPEADSTFASNSRVVPSLSTSFSPTSPRHTSRPSPIRITPENLRLADATSVPRTVNFAADTSPRISSPIPGPTQVVQSRARAASAGSMASSLPLQYGSRPSYFGQPTSHIPMLPIPPPVPEPLKVGEVLYWHHLFRSGEIPAVSEDPRARFDPDAPEVGTDGSSRRHAVPSGIVVAGR
ncbi:uncharacterized protein BXZ73DRAFT_88682 [Epithele typhae]|uniref:uncharacterized protein n=1 Tax=Epithele typhae TaxID=378194 RepID=UPI0020087296|nr:uncharacterized protein BXZ73DRAFT_88682 [Epithele typhae]KAH9940438.1 hypothetical protein BXZ73DRAFT_88682 [Epithele typhae]